MSEMTANDLAYIKDANALLRAEGRPSEIREVLVAEIERLRAIIDARLCAKHADAAGLYAVGETELQTANGGGCVVCIGMRVDAENELLRATLAERQDATACRDGQHTLVWHGEAAGYFKGTPPLWAKCSRCNRTYEAIVREREAKAAA